LITATYGVPRASNADAWVALEAFLALPQVEVMHEPPELGRHWCQLGAIPETAPKRWMDAYLAAFAMAAGVQLVSLDRDFNHFEPQGLSFQLLQVDAPGTTGER
jgi:predicted nucleic acid-binding protein